MNLIIAGGRDFDDYTLLCRKLEQILANTDKATMTLFSGQARGADYLGERWVKAQRPRIPIRWFPANWDKHGKKAGMLRNQEMLDAGATHLVAFWDGKSKGTDDMITRGKREGISVRVINYEGRTNDNNSN
jgi:hypothetical protein